MHAKGAGGVETETFLDDGGEVREGFEGWVRRWGCGIGDCGFEFVAELGEDSGIGEEMVGYC